MTDLERKMEQNVITLDDNDEDFEADQEVWKINEGALYPFRPAFQDDNVVITKRQRKKLMSKKPKVPVAIVKSDKLLCHRFILKGRRKLMIDMKQLKPNGHKLYKEDPR
jgi:hypothetical protein